MKGKRSKSQTEPTGRGMGDVKLLRPKAVQGIGGKSPHPQDKVAGCSSLLGPVSTYLPPGARAFLETCLLPELCLPVPPGPVCSQGVIFPRIEPSPARSQASLGPSPSSMGAHFCLLASALPSPAWCPRVWVQGSTAYPRHLPTCRSSRVPGALTLVLSPAASSCVTQAKHSPL